MTSMVRPQDESSSDLVHQKKLQIQQQQQQQRSQDLNPPEIPHITTNFVPLSRVLTNLVFQSYSELTNILETLPSVNSDLARKRRLLDYLVKCRQEFVKAYVLTKWAKVSDQISTCIDVVSWLNGQQNCFTNVVNVLYDIERTLGGAKLRNPDIETALEVLKSGQPTFNSHGFISPKKIGPRVVLSTLQDLNVLLSIRLALTEQLPPLYRNYKIEDGRVKFVVDNSFVVSLGIADDSVDARFFMIDFEFFIGNAIQPLSAELKIKIEKVVNNMLSSQNLSVVFDWMIRFSQNYKLSVVNQQLNDLERGLWAGVLRHVFYPDKSLIAIQYWTNAVQISPSSSITTATQTNVKRQNIVEIGLLRSFEIGVRWLREGKHIDSHKLEFGQGSLSVEKLLQQVINLHIQYILDGVYSNFIHLLSSKSERGLSVCASENEEDNESIITRMGDVLRIQLTNSRHTSFSIDSLTGRAVLQHPTQIVMSAERSLNELVDKASQSAPVLLRLRQISIQEEIASRAKATGWVSNETIKISNDDLRKYFSDDNNITNVPSSRSITSLRLPTWSYKWFLLISTRSDSLMPRWWICWLESKDNIWSVRFIEEIRIVGNKPEEQTKTTEYDYKFFNKLASFATTRIRVYTISSQLQTRNVKFTFLPPTSSDKLKVPLNGNEFGPIILININSFLPNSHINWAHSSLFIRMIKKDDGSVKVLTEGKTMRQLSLDSVPSDDSGVVLDASTGKFSITLDLIEDVVKNKNKSELIDDLILRLLQIERVVSYVELIKAASLKLHEASMSRITFEYGNGSKARILLGKGEQDKSTDDPIKLEIDAGSPHYEVVPLLQEILKVNGLSPVLWLLLKTLPMYQALRDLKLRLQKSVFMVTRSATEMIAIFGRHENCQLEIKLVDTPNKQIMIYITESKKKGDTNNKLYFQSLWQQRIPGHPGIVPLMEGIACPLDKFKIVLDKIEEIVRQSEL